MSRTVITFPQKPLVTGVGVVKVPSYARKLASSLMWSMQIQEGVGLVCVIGKGDEYSNQRAIETWLMTQYSEDVIASMQAPLTTMAKSLECHINEYYYNKEMISC